MATLYTIFPDIYKNEVYPYMGKHVIVLCPSSRVSMTERALMKPEINTSGIICIPFPDIYSYEVLPYKVQYVIEVDPSSRVSTE